jgi:hypothetical protein
MPRTSDNGGGGGGGVSNVTASAPLSSSGGATPDISYVGPFTSPVEIDQGGLLGANLILNQTGFGGSYWIVKSSGAADPAGAGAYAVQSYTDGTTPFVIMPVTNFVGINTTSPISELTISGVQTFIPHAETVCTYGMQMVDVNTAIQWIPSTGIIFKNAFSGPSGDRAIIRGDGSVGIGTTSPSYKLDINGTFRCVNDANLNANVNVGGETSFTSSSENVVSFGQQLVGSTAVQWIPSTGLHFKYNATGLGGFLVSITSAGNVGIGTTTPNSKLAVSGLPVYADNASAITGGLVAGDFYRTGGDPDLVCVVH